MKGLAPAVPGDSAADHARVTHSTTRTGAGMVLLLAVWFGLLTGFGELASVMSVTYILDRFLSHWGWHRVWMTPLADVLIFLVPGLLLALCARFWPHRVTLRTCVTIFSILGTLCLALFFHGRIHILALLVLACGAGVQTGRMAAARAAGFQRWVRRTAPVMAGLVLVLGLAVSTWWRVSERRGLARLPAGPAGAPNVLLLILDTVRAMNLGLHGYERPTTPSLERLAARGVTFDWAMSTAPWTLPAHASMFTGRYPFETRAYYRTPLDRSFPTLAEALQARGYATAAFMANAEYAGRATGLARGFLHFEDYVPSVGQVFFSSGLVRAFQWNRPLRRALRYYELLGRKGAEQINASFLGWQRTRTDRPFFAVLNYFDAHAPYLPPAPYDTLFGAATNRHYLVQQERYIDVVQPEVAPYVASELAAYDAAITYLDDQLGRLLDELERRGVLQNTVVIVTSDHGEEFGEHGRLGHAYNLHTSLLHVPLIMVAPGRVPSAQRVRVPVSLRDIPATVMSIVGAGESSLFPGQSLTRTWDPGKASGEATQEMVVSSEGDMLSLFSGRHHYIRLGTGREQLFDYAADPLEQRDLFNSEAGRSISSQFRAALPAPFAAGRTGTFH
jgi:arylsulfatase A-like enzyme